MTTLARLNPFDKSCFGWHCSRSESCKHYNREADTRLQFYISVGNWDDCPYYEIRRLLDEEDND